MVPDMLFTSTSSRYTICRVYVERQAEIIKITLQLKSKKHMDMT